MLVKRENLEFYKSVSQLEYLKAHYQLFLRSWKKWRFLTNLQWMAHTLLKFIAPEMSQNLVPTLQSLDQLNASTGGIADVGYLPRANKVSSKNAIHLRDTYSSLSSMSPKFLIPKLSLWNQIRLKLLLFKNKIRIVDTSFCTEAAVQPRQRWCSLQL